MANLRAASNTSDRNGKSTKATGSFDQANTCEPQSPVLPKWSTRTKTIVSLLVVFQLLAVLAEPLHFFTHSPARGSSPAVRPLRAAMAPYIEFTYLNHGYFFFAPEPGPSHLIQCSLLMTDGTTGTVRYPDKQAQWPRLLYHRHFMLTEFLNMLYVPPVDPAARKELPEFEFNDWQIRRKRYEQIRDSMQSHLARRYDASSATIERLQHTLPLIEEVLGKDLSLTDARFYIVLPDSLPTQPEMRPVLPMPPLARPSKSGGESVEVKQ